MEIVFKGLYLALRKNEADGVMVRMLVDGAACPAAKQFWRLGGKV